MARYFSSIVLLCVSLFVLSSIYSGSSAPSDQCKYMLLIKTGSVQYAGTDSIIDIEFDMGILPKFRVDNLANYGLLGPQYDYFENNHLDVFQFPGPCVAIPPICKATITSDGSGSAPGWFVDYVILSADYPVFCNMERNATVNQWLAADVGSLTADVNFCS